VGRSIASSDLAAEALEAAGEVADVEAQGRARVPAPAAADGPAHGVPLGDPAALDVARAECQVGPVARGREQAREVGRVV
jgi:hypothetical protein